MPLTPDQPRRAAIPAHQSGLRLICQRLRRDKNPHFWLWDQRWRISCAAERIKISPFSQSVLGWWWGLQGGTGARRACDHDSRGVRMGKVEEGWTLSSVTWIFTLVHPLSYFAQLQHIQHTCTGLLVYAAPLRAVVRWGGAVWMNEQHTEWGRGGRRSRRRRGTARGLSWTVDVGLSSCHTEQHSVRSCAWALVRSWYIERHDLPFMWGGLTLSAITFWFRAQAADEYSTASDLYSAQGFTEFSD